MILSPMPTAKISSAAERMRRSRARRRQGLRLVQVQLRETEIDALIESGWLEERSRNDPNAVVDAVHRLFDRVFSRMTRNAARTWWLATALMAVWSHLDRVTRNGQGRQSIHIFADTDHITSRTDLWRASWTRITPAGSPIHGSLIELPKSFYLKCYCALHFFKFQDGDHPWQE
jgi:hypothetical protein